MPWTLPPLNGAEFFRVQKIATLGTRQVVTEVVRATTSAPAVAAPVNTVAPALTATAGVIGTPVSCSQGTWTSVETPTFTYQWLRDGLAISGATQSIYTPGADDDLTDLSCRVTATNSGGSTQIATGAIEVRYAPPVSLGLSNEIYDEGTGTQIIQTALGFSGSGLTFSITGAAFIDSFNTSTGELRILTSTVTAATSLTVTAANSGGSAEDTFTVTIAESGLGGGAPAPLDVADWSVEVYDLGSGRFTGEIVVAESAAADGAFNMFWTNQVSTFQDPPFDLDYVSPRRWRMTNKLNGVPTVTEWHVKTYGEQLGNIAVRYQLTDGGEISGNSLDRKSFTAPLDENPDPGTPPPDVPVGSPTPTTSRTSISLDTGSTITFSKAMQCGQYWNGDWFVYNPVGSGGFAVTSFTPNSVNRSDGTRMHGLMRDPVINRTSFRDRALQGWDGYANGNWMSRHTRHDDALNVNPNLKGNINFTAGQEGSLYKAVSLTTPNDSGRSIFSKFFIVTVVNAIPPVGAFRPAPDRDVTSKAAIATIDQLANVTHPIVNVQGSIQYSISQVKRYLTGPFIGGLSLGARPYSAYYGQEQTFPKDDPLYNAVFGQAVNAAHAHLMNSATSTADRREIMALMCQIGLDIMQSGAHFDRFEYSPSHSFAGFRALIDFAAVCLDNVAVRATHDMCVANDLFHEKVLKQGDTFDENGGNPGTGTKTSLRYIDATDIWFRTPPEGINEDKPDNPTQTPFIADQEWGFTGTFTGGHIGFPFTTGSGSPNGGFHSNMNMSYRRLSWITTPSLGLVAAYNCPSRSGVNVVSNILCGVMDRYQRYFQGHHDGLWDMAGAPEYASGWTVWDFYLLDLVKKTRSSFATEAPVWEGPPEQPFPPLVSSPNNGQLRLQFLPCRVSNFGALTDAQYKLRKIRNSNISGSWQLNSTLRQLVFRNSAAWDTPVDVAPDVTTLTLTGLDTGIWQVQWRLKNNHPQNDGWGPWSTNCGYTGDERAKNGWPAGPRGVVFVP